MPDTAVIGGAAQVRYLQLTYTYAPAWGFGGPSRMMYDYARWLAAAGREARVISGDVHHDYSANRTRHEVMQGISIRRVRVFMRGLVRRSLNCVSPSMLLLALRSVLRGRQVTVVHIAEFRSPVFLYAAVLRRIVPGRVVLVHSAFGMLHEKKSRLRSFYDPLFMGFMLGSVDIGLAQNEHEQAAYEEYCRRFGARRARVVLLPLHTPGPAPGSLAASATDDARAALRRRYQVPGEAFVAIFLGRLHPEKGILRAIDAFLAYAGEAGRPALMYVVGRDDGFQDAIERHIAARGAHDKVRLVTDVYEQRFEYYAMADVFLGFPTIHEETMLASVEALSCGTPVVVSREADLPFVQAGGAGFVIDFSVEAAVARLREVGADTTGFRARASAVARAHFAEAAACAAFQGIIEEAALQRAARVH